MHKLSKPPIKEVNIGLSLASSFADKKEVDSFFSKIKQNSFIEQRERRRTCIHGIPKSVRIQDSLDGYVFSSKDQTQILTLGKIYFSLTSKKYSGFDSFIKQYLNLLQMAKESIPSLEIGEDRVLEYHNKMFLPFDKATKGLKILPVIMLNPEKFSLHQFTSRYNIPCNSGQLADVFVEYISNPKGLDISFNIKVQGKFSFGRQLAQSVEEDFNILHKLSDDLFFDNVTKDYLKELE